MAEGVREHAGWHGGWPRERDPILANLFLHYAFDRWMKENNPDIPFERYADDAILSLSQ
jgi:hypothetical protein